MGRSHALSGAAVGLWVAPLAGLGDLAAAVPFATAFAVATVAAVLTFPDLDDLLAGLDLPTLASAS